jgi:hypothetical protein
MSTQQKPSPAATPEVAEKDTRVEYTFTKRLRPATRADFIWNKQVIYHSVYYARSFHTDKLYGPYILTPSTNMDEFSVFLREGKVYTEMIDD